MESPQKLQDPSPPEQQTEVLTCQGAAKERAGEP